MNTNSKCFVAALVLSGPLLVTPPRCSAANPLDTWHVRQAPGSSPKAGFKEGFEGVAYGNGRWVIVGDDGSILSSTDGVEWTAEFNPSAPTRLDDVAFGNGIFMAVGRSGGM